MRAHKASHTDPTSFHKAIVASGWFAFSFRFYRYVCNYSRYMCVFERYKVCVLRYSTEVLPTIIEGKMQVTERSFFILAIWRRCTHSL